MYVGSFGEHSLNGWVNSGSVGHYAADNPTLASNQQIGSAYSGSDACEDLKRMIVETTSYDTGGNRVTYNPVPTLYGGGWSSNSFTSTLLNSVGPEFSFGPLPD